jgi:MSHA biogenesis protein MshI
MGLFSGRSKKPGWLALGLRSDRVDLVHVRRSASSKPEITLCETYRKEGADAATLARLVKEFKLNRYHCTTLLNSDEYQLHQLDAPSVPAAEMKNAIRWRVKDLIDYPLESATVDVFSIPADRNAPARSPGVCAVTARNSVIEAYAASFNEADVPLEAIDIPDLAQRNIAALYEQGPRGVAMLAFYEHESILTFTGGGELYFSRRIDARVDQVVATDDAQRERTFERIALELQRSLDNFGRQFHHLPIATLLLAPLPRDCGLRQYLATNIDVPVETIDLATVMTFPSAPELKHAERQSQCLATIGAALRGEHKAAA